MGKSTILCARCGHTKREHDDPLMEGMCAHDGCECLMFTLKRLGNGPGSTPAPTAQQARPAPSSRPSTVPTPASARPVPTAPAATEQPAPMTPPTPTRAATGTRTKCDSKCPNCGVACSGPSGHTTSRRRHYRSGRGGHTWGDTQSTADCYDGPSEAELAHRAAIGESYASEIEGQDSDAHRKRADLTAELDAHMSETTWPSQAGRMDHDPTHGQIDRDIQEKVDAMEPSSLGQRVAMENTLQERRRRGTYPPPEQPGPEPQPEDSELEPESSESQADPAAEPEADPPGSVGPVDPVVADVSPAVAAMADLDERYDLAKRKHKTGLKRCPQCTLKRPIGDFYTTKTGDGLFGWCKPCVNERTAPMTLERALRNRARHRARAELVARHRPEFQQLYEQMMAEARVEAGLLQDDVEAQEVYGEDEHVRLRPGRRAEGETALDRIDVARCPECIRYHDSGHACAVCGSTPEHRAITESAWAGAQRKYREQYENREAQA